MRTLFFVMATESMEHQIAIGQVINDMDISIGDTIKYKALEGSIVVAPCVVCIKVGSLIRAS